MSLQKETGTSIKPHHVLEERWNDYYTSAFVRPFGNHTELYESSLIKEMFQNPNLLDPSNAKVFVLGGFHAYNDTVDDFKEFCQKMHNNPDDKHIYLDMNRLPLSSIRARSQKYRTQALLENLPFKNGSIDFLFADCTTDFMDNAQVQQFSKSSAETLSDNGLILIAKIYPPGLERQQNLHPTLPLYPRNIQDVQELMDDLKLVGFNYGYSSSVATFARKDSIFPEHMLSKMEMEEIYPDK